MERWRQILRRWAPRGDVEKPFYPDREDAEKPVLLNANGPLAAAFVAARLLRAVVARGGSRVKPSAVQTLEELIARGLSESVIHHCEAETERILEWINARPLIDDDTGHEVSGAPDFEVMINADLESRLSVARFALEEGYGLELEYFDDDSATWPRRRAELEDIEGAEPADFETALRLRDREGPFDVELRHIRWLMPVADIEIDRSETSGGDVLEFPGLDDERES